MHQQRQMTGPNPGGRVRGLFIMAIVGLVLAFPMASGAYVENFSSGDAGWLYTTVNDGGTVTYQDPYHFSSGGNPDGYICSPLSTDVNRLYGLEYSSSAPSASSVFGNLLNQNLTVDFRLTGQVTGPVGAKVRFYFGSNAGGSNYFVSNDTFSWDPNSATSWTTKQVVVSAANFIDWPNQATHNLTFAEVALQYNDIGLVFADGFTNNQTLGFTGSCAISIDNFGVTPVPVPAAIWLFSSGLMGVLGLRRRLGSSPT